MSLSADNELKDDKDINVESDKRAERYIKYVFESQWNILLIAFCVRSILFMCVAITSVTESVGYYVGVILI